MKKVFIIIFCYLFILNFKAQKTVIITNNAGEYKIGDKIIIYPNYVKFIRSGEETSCRIYEIGESGEKYLSYMGVEFGYIRDYPDKKIIYRNLYGDTKILHYESEAAYQAKQQQIYNQNVKEDKLTFNEIDKLLKQEDYTAAFDKLDKLNFTYTTEDADYARVLNEIKRQEINRFNKINSLALNNQFDDAFKLYVTLLNPNEFVFINENWSAIEEDLLLNRFTTIKEKYKTDSFKIFIQNFLTEKINSYVKNKQFD